MKNTIKSRIAQLTLALALTFGSSLSADAAASLPDVMFGQSVTSTFQQSSSARPVHLGCVADTQDMIVDADTGLLLGEQTYLTKYAFMNNMLYQVEVEFKSSSKETYKKLYASLASMYGKGDAQDHSNPAQNYISEYCTWELEDKSIVLCHVEYNGCQTLVLNSLAKRADVHII